MTNESNRHYDPNAVGRGVENQHLSVEHLSDQEFDDLLQRERPREAAVRRQYGMDRRTFMKLMGGSLAIVGFGAACTAEPPGEEIIPYVIAPEVLVPGIPLYFNSTMTIGGFATGVTIETHQGRPTRVDGNPEHPAALGGSNTYMQGSILELYNPDRETRVLRNRQPDTFDNFLQDLESVLSDAQSSRIAILTEGVSSPTIASRLNAVLEAYPGARWYQYEPVTRDNVIAGAQLAFDQVVNTVYRFDQANVVVSLDANFMYAMPGSLRYARDFAARRKVLGADPDTAEMNRLYVAESTPSVTGTMADHRLALSPSDVEALARAIASELGVDVSGRVTSDAWDAAWFNALLEDLEQNEGASIVVAGDEQPPVVHALVHAINAALGNVGNTVYYTAPVEANPVSYTEQITALVDDITARQVEAVFILGGNPVYNAPADVPFADLLAEVPFTVHLSLYNDETSRQCEWHIPQTHFIEEWSDGRAYDGSLSVVQPPIGPLYDTVRSANQMLGLLLEDDDSDYDVVRALWEDLYEGDDFEAYWRRTLHDGLAPDSAYAALEVALRADFGAQVNNEPTASSNDLELVFRTDPNIYDGRFSHNSWLQELPKPITQLSWDTAALLSPATAERLDVSFEDLVEVQLNDNTMEVPVWVVPGHADNTVSIFLGYGTSGGADVDDDRNFNAYDIRTTAAMWTAAGASLNALDESYKLAAIRGEIDLDDLEGYLEPLVRTGTLNEYRQNPNFAHEGETSVPMATAFDLREYEEGYAWAMTLDLTACMGCNACIIACQSENTIPTVGKEQVLKAREMHWLRVDRHFLTEGDETHVAFLPVPCMHCETAPCEIVCPVEATVHDSEGLNTMVYNRCIGTRYCSANCPYNVRRFNFLKWIDDDETILEEQRNPDVTVRSEGVMEKCTYCIQRISAARIHAKNEDRRVFDGEIQPACAVACPTQVISFGDLNTENSQVNQHRAEPLNYELLGELGTRPRTTYLARLSNPNEALHGQGEGE
jgi:MoCo/4Fe-4S cofactor protein with predicted Tat translocation signal